MKFAEKNGYKISEFTLGTVQLGIPYGINNKSGKPSYEQSAKILQTAIDGGIVSFDTAKGYGESEAVLGRFFSCNNAEKTLITKVEFDKETPSEIKDSLFNKAKDSIKVLGVSRLPLVLLHSEAYLDTYGKTITDALALSYMRGIDGITSLVLGCETSKQLTESLSLFDMPNLSADVADKINEISEQIEPVVIRPWEWNK